MFSNPSVLQSVSLLLFRCVFPCSTIIPVKWSNRYFLDGLWSHFTVYDEQSRDFVNESGHCVFRTWWQYLPPDACLQHYLLISLIWFSPSGCGWCSCILGPRGSPISSLLYPDCAPPSFHSPSAAATPTNAQRERKEWRGGGEQYETMTIFNQDNRDTAQYIYKQLIWGLILAYYWKADLSESVTEQQV